MFLELFKLQERGRRGLAAFIGSLHSFAGIRYFLHGIYYGFLVILFGLGLFVSFMPSTQSTDTNSSIEVKLPKNTSLTLEKADLKTSGNEIEKPNTYDTQKWIILVGTFVLCLTGMIIISVTSDRKREQRWKCISKYMSKKQKEKQHIRFPLPNVADEIEETIYFVFSGGENYTDGEKTTFKQRLQGCDCDWIK
jgi:hypothetical protein